MIAVLGQLRVGLKSLDGSADQRRQRFQERNPIGWEQARTAVGQVDHPDDLLAAAQGNGRDGREPEFDAVAAKPRLRSRWQLADKRDGVIAAKRSAGSHKRPLGRSESLLDGPQAAAVIPLDRELVLHL